MQRLFQLAAVVLALVVLTILACRAQSRAPEAASARPAAVDAGADAPTARANPPAVYLPASKSGGMFLEHQQAPR